MASNVYEKLRKAGELGERAITIDEEQGDIPLAFKVYMTAINHYEYCYKYAPTAEVKLMVRNTMIPFIDRATELKEVLDKMRQNRMGALRTNVGLKDNDDEAPVIRRETVEPASERGGNPELRKALQSALLDDKPDVRLDDVVGLEEAKKALNMAVILPLQAPQLFKGSGMKPWTGILLYGPAGTGKTFLAKAVAGECGATFFSVSSSTIRDKYVGQSEKMVAELFAMARERRPSVIFVDEVESLLAQRGAYGGSTHDDKLVTEFLAQMQGATHSNDGVLVLGATNEPWAIDEAARRRFQRRVYVPLPGTLERAEMMRRGFKGTFTFDRPFIEELANVTEGYSGSDIDTMVQLAKSTSIEDVLCASHFKPDPANTRMLIPCAPGDEGARAMTFTATVDKRVFSAAPVREDSIRKALRKTKPSVDPERLPRFDEWTAKFGVEGSNE
jgi:vacuolar protein-sorting-associated protein 4